MDTESLQIHPVAEATPLMVEEQFEALKDSIEIRGQQEPGITYRGRLIDGRHRLKALLELGEKKMKVTKLANNTTLKELEDVVATSECGRHQTPTQLAIFAFKGYESKRYSTILQSAKSVGISNRQVLRAKNIAVKYNRPDIIELLYAGQSIATGNGHTTTTSLATIENQLKLIGAQQSKDVTGIEQRTEPSEDEELLIGQVLSRVRSESKVCQEALAKRLYSQLQELTDSVEIKNIPTYADNGVPK